MQLKIDIIYSAGSYNPTINLDPYLARHAVFCTHPGHELLVYICLIDHVHCNSLLCVCIHAYYDYCMHMHA